MSKQADGGRARAAKLSSVERAAIARKAAEARWAGKDIVLPRETHPGALHIGNADIQCSVLEDKTRVLSQRAMVKAFGSLSRGGRSRGKGDAETGSDDGGARLPRIFESKGLKSHISEDLMVALANPISYRPKHGGRPAFGYEATLLPRLCSAILEARDEKDLAPNQVALAIQADILIRALAQVGIVALIDEATGYEADKDRDDLQRLLEIYISKERLKWIKTFPNEFFDQIFRLRGWQKPVGSNATPRYIGKLINKIVYDQLPEGVLEELRNKNPVDYETKRRKWKHHQFLTEDIGQPDLRTHVQQLLIVMRLSGGWEDFERNFIQAFKPEVGIEQALDFEED